MARTRRNEARGKQEMDKVSYEQDSDDEIVLVPVPKRYLSAVYRVLAENMSPARTVAIAGTNELRHAASERGENMIDLIVKVAHQMNADRQPVSLSQLHNAYLQAYPGIGKGNTPDSFSATINFYTINMRSRFPDIRDKRKQAAWLLKPTFKRVGRGQYMLLSSAEIARFKKSVERADDTDDPQIYHDNYDVDALPE
jgi:hypothetical protein